MGQAINSLKLSSKRRGRGSPLPLDHTISQSTKIWRKLFFSWFHPQFLRPWQAVLSVAVLFYLSWIAEYFIFQGYARLDLLTPLILVWALKAPRSTWLISLAFASLLYETSAARPMGMTFGPLLSASILLNVVQDSLILSRFQVWLSVFLLASLWMSLWEWTSFWLLSSTIHFSFQDLLAILVHISSAVAFGAYYVSKIGFSSLKDPGPGSLS
jgi:hypothetical protein